MESKCLEYANVEPALSPLGRQWSAYVRSCLQKILAKQTVAAPSGKVDCQTVTDVFFGSHLNCYLKGPVSFCQLPLLDMGRIVAHGASIIFSRYWYEPLVSGAKLMSACSVYFWETRFGSRTTSGNALGEATEACNSQNATKSLQADLQVALGLRNWTITFLPANVTATTVPSLQDGTMVVLSSNDTNRYPLNTTLAMQMTTDAMSRWLNKNPQCTISFNGKVVPTKALLPQRRQR